MVTDTEGNIRIYRLPKGRGQGSGTDIAQAGGPYHDPRAVCLSCYCPLCAYISIPVCII